MESIKIKEEIAELKLLLYKKHLKLSGRYIRKQLERIIDADMVFPEVERRALLLQLLHNYETTKKKEVIILEEPDPETRPAVFVLGVLAEDWPGMSNSILGIIHHKKRNVLYMVGSTLKFEDRDLGIVILTFCLKSSQEYDHFIQNKKELTRQIKDAARGSTSKYMLLDDEAVKYEIYNKIIKKIRQMYHNSELVKVIDESGEVLKFVSSRSREYLEERKLKDLASLILNNYIFQNIIKSGSQEEIVKIKNFTTKFEELTGITFVCKEHLFSIEDFLKTLNHIVPHHLIKHHKSYVTSDGILVYRIEITDRNEKPLDSKLIKFIESSLDKLITIACSKKFSKMKSVGGFEHYARAIIPFLKEELKRTRLSQVFISVDGKSEFSIKIRLVIVSFKTGGKRVYKLLSRLSTVPGIDIHSSIPPRVHSNNIEINIMKMQVDLPEFTSIKEIYNTIKGTIIKIYGEIRDFDEGFRDIYIRILNQLLDNLKHVDAGLVREIFFNIDELYKIEISPNLLLELIRICSEAVMESRDIPSHKILFKHKHLPVTHRTVVVVSYSNHKRLISRLVQKLADTNLYFTKIEWEQRSFLIMILSKDNDIIDDKSVQDLIDAVGECELT